MDCCLLPSVDLEITRDEQGRVIGSVSRFVDITRELLAFFAQRRLMVTFFVVARDLIDQLDLVEEIKTSGHEVACHSWDHNPRVFESRARFKAELTQCHRFFRAAGLTRVNGFRCPYFLLTERNQWIWDELAASGYRYSSSVLPGRNPISGWPGSPKLPYKTNSGIWEIPISVINLGPFAAPIFGGVYLRVAPILLIKLALSRFNRSGKPIVSYIHPYDFDSGGDGVLPMKKSRFMNFLQHRNRQSTLEKLSWLCSMALILTYADYVDRLDPLSSNLMESIAPA